MKNAEEKVAKEILFFLNHFFQLLWIPMTFGQLLSESSSLLWSLIIKPGSWVYSALLSHIRLQFN